MYYSGFDDCCDFSRPLIQRVMDVSEYKKMSIHVRMPNIMYSVRQPDNLICRRTTRHIRRVLKRLDI